MEPDRIKALEARVCELEALLREIASFIYSDKSPFYIAKVPDGSQWEREEVTHHLELMQRTVLAITPQKGAVQ